MLILCVLTVYFPHRSEQDKEPEQEVVSEVVGSGPSEETVTDGM